MHAMQVAQRMTADEFIAAPETPGERWDLVDGEVVVHQPKLPHQLAVDALRTAFALWESPALPVEAVFADR